MSADATPDLSEDPVREQRLTTALTKFDATHDVDAAALARLEQRLSAVLTAPRSATEPLTVSAPPTVGVDAEIDVAPVSMSLGLLLFVQQKQRWISLSAAAAAAAVIVALSMTPRATPAASSTLVAYVGGRAGAGVVADAALGLDPSPADMFGKGGRR